MAATVSKSFRIDLPPSPQDEPWQRMPRKVVDQSCVKEKALSSRVAKTGLSARIGTVPSDCRALRCPSAPSATDRKVLRARFGDALHSAHLGGCCPSRCSARLLEDAVAKTR